MAQGDIQMKLVDNARDGWKWFSNWAFALLASIPLVWPQLPPDVREMLPEAWEPWALTAIALGGIVSRMLDQGGRYD